MFPADQEQRGIMVFAEEQWQEHHATSRIFGINISTPDLYPVLKYPEARKKYKRVNQSPGPAKQGSHDHNGQSSVEICVEEPQVASCDSHVTNRMVSIDQIDSEFEKLKRIRSSCIQPEWQGAASGVGVVNEALNGRLSPLPLRKNGNHNIAK